MSSSAADFSARLAQRVLKSLTHLNEQLREAREAINRVDDAATRATASGVSAVDGGFDDAAAVLPPTSAPTSAPATPHTSTSTAPHNPQRSTSPSRRGVRGSAADDLVHFLLSPALANGDAESHAALAAAAAAAGVSPDVVDAVRAHWAHGARRPPSAALQGDGADTPLLSPASDSERHIDPSLAGGASDIVSNSPVASALARPQPPLCLEPLLREMTDVDFEARDFTFERFRVPRGAQGGGFGEIPLDQKTMDLDDFEALEAEAAQEFNETNAAAPPVIDDEFDPIDEDEAFTVSVKVAVPRVRTWVGGDPNLWPHMSEPLADFPGSHSGTREPREHFEFATGAAESPGGRARPPRFDAFALPVVYQSGRTGFSDSKEFFAPPNSLIAGRFLVHDTVGNAAFSSAMSCTDLAVVDEEGRNETVCLKVVKNNKDFVDQSLDEIKLLRYLNEHAKAETESENGADFFCILKLREYFYFQEHLFLVTELLKDNLCAQRPARLCRRPAAQFTSPSSPRCRSPAQVRVLRIR
jgi:hypothetical protein